MKTFTKKTMAVLGLLAFCGMAQADVDLETLSPELSGLYAGVNAGLLITRVNLESTHVGFTPLIGRCAVNTTFSSFAPSVQLGYIHRFDSRLMLGFEGDFSYHTNQKADLVCPCDDPSYSDNFSFYNRMQGSIRGKMGYSFLDSRLFAFLTGGASFADLGLSYSNEAGDRYAVNVAATGALFGGGVEWKASSDWSLRAEYHFVAYGSVDMPMPVIYKKTDPNGAAQAYSYGNNVKIGANYWFW